MMLLVIASSLRESSHGNKALPVKSLFIRLSILCHAIGETSLQNSDVVYVLSTVMICIMAWSLTPLLFGFLCLGWVG
jgi:hypothetical protein